MNASRFDELRELVARQTLDHPMRKLLPTLTAARATQRGPLTPYLSDPTLSLVLQGAKRVILNDQAFHYKAGQFLVVSVDLPLSGHILQASRAEPFLGLALTLSPELVCELVQETTARLRDNAPSQVIAVSELSDELLEPLVRLVRLAEQPEDLPVLGKSIEREITWRLLRSELGDMVRQLGRADSHMAHVSRAISWIRKNFATPTSVDTLARTAGMSVTSFHRHFRRMTKMSPIQFTQHVRLHEARSSLLASTKNVSTVAFESGYNSPSQFTREYKRLFGVRPGDEGRAAPTRLSASAR